MFALLAVNIAHTQFGLGGGGSTQVLNAWGQNLVLACACAVVAVRVRTGGAPGCKPLLAGMVLWTVGNLWWGFVLYGMADAPFPSPADAGWLAFYPCAYLCLGLRLHASARDLPAQRLARRPGRDPLGRRDRRQPRRGADPRGRRGEPGGRADQRRLPARRPAAARPHGRGARPARTARRPRMGAAGRRVRAVRRRRLALPRAPRRRHLRRRHGARLAVGGRAGDHGAGQLAAAREAREGRSRPPRRAGPAAALRRRRARRCSSTPASRTSRRSRSRSPGRPCSPR